MSESDFRARCERVMRAIEDAIDASGADVDTTLTDSVLEIEFADGATLVVSANAPMEQLWLAAPSGAFHYRHEGGRWIDTRGGDEMPAVLSGLIERHAGVGVELAL